MLDAESPQGWKQQCDRDANNAMESLDAGPNDFDYGIKQSRSLCYLILRVSTRRVLYWKTDSQSVDFDSMWPHPNRYNKDNWQEIKKTSGKERANTITCELFDRLFTRLPLSSSRWDKEHHLYSYPGKCSQPVNPTKVLTNLLKA